MNEIAVESITKKFGGFAAVDNISLYVPKGGICGVLGPNGAGKTTFIRMLCGLLLPTECRGSVSGFDIMTEYEEIKRRIGYMSQKFSLYPFLTVEENINFWAKCYSLSSVDLKRKKEEIFEILKLEKLRNVAVRVLTGGNRQRCALACAIIHNPSVVFLDEPTSGADPLARRDFWKIIGKLSEEGISVLVTTHYLEEAEYCRQILLISGGKKVAEGSPTDLKKECASYVPEKKNITLEDVFILKTK